MSESNGTTIYRIAGWNEFFENWSSQRAKNLTWLKVPIKHDGDSYIELVSHTDGAAHLAAWLVMLQTAATCSPRGVLVRANGQPHDAESIARKTRIPANIISAAIPRLVKIGWIEPHDGVLPMPEPRKEEAPEPQETPAEAPAATDTPPEAPKDVPAPENTPEATQEAPKAKKTKAKPADSLPGFDRFWSSWPKNHRKVAKPECLAHWRSAELEKHADLIAFAIEQAKKTTDWKKEKGQYIPAPLVWLHQQRWHPFEEDFARKTAAIEQQQAPTPAPAAAPAPVTHQMATPKPAKRPWNLAENAQWNEYQKKMDHFNRGLISEKPELPDGHPGKEEPPAQMGEAA